MENKFKVGDIVYDSVVYPNQKGKIVNIRLSDLFPIKVLFESEGSNDYYTIDGCFNGSSTPTLSFTPYELSGFTQERPWTPKEGEYVAVKNKNQISTWVIGKFSKISELGLFEIYEASNQFEQIKPLTDFITENNKLK